MQLGIFAKTFAGTTPSEVMQGAAEAGYFCVQYNMACSGLAAMPDHISSDVAAAIADASTSTNLKLSAVSGTYNMVHPDPSVRAIGLKRLAVLAEKSKSFGTSIITLCTGSRDADDQWRHHAENDSPEAWHDLVVEIEKAVNIAESYDVILAIEPELANVVSSAAKAKQLLTHINSKHLKIVLDAANLFEREGLVDQQRIVAEAIDLLGEHIVIAHAKDRSVDGTFAAAGRGVLDYDHYLLQLQKSEFNGPVITHGLAAGEARDVAKFLATKIAGSAR